MTIADLIKEFIETSKERLKSPFSGAFLWSFTIYNWRPILLLMFSNASMEDKIVVINHEYCKPSAILWPISMAVFYIVVLPFIMWLFDWPVVFAKKIRLSKVYENKNNILQEKIDIAAKTLELRNAETGNKEIQNIQEENATLKDQIFTLQESIKQINESNKITIDSLNTKLADANNMINQRQKGGQGIDYNTNSIIEDLYLMLPPDYRKTFYQIINSDDKIDLDTLPSRIREDFLALKLFVRDSNEPSKWLISDSGLRLFNLIGRRDKLN